MAGIYIHVPFCKKACHYCNFHFSTSLALKDNFVEALLHEITLASSSANGHLPYLGDETIETLYFGGGTPSLLEQHHLELIFSQLRKHFLIAEMAELTFEANPDDITISKLKEWKEAGINRLSIGVQSFFDDHLTWMNRAHTAGQSEVALENARMEGFTNMSIDLIYGIPGLSDEQWKYNVQKAIDLGVPHLSCYALTVEPSTALQKMIRQKKTADVDPELQASQFLLLTDWAEAAGYEHYEISNFALPGMRSRHNSSYWQGKKYLGLGPSAHSFDGVSRQWNVSNNSLYIQSLKQNRLPVEKETLTPTQQFNEYIMTSLRTSEGVDMTHVENAFGMKAAKHLNQLSLVYLKNEKLTLEDNALRLTRSGKLYADGIAAALFR